MNWVYLLSCLYCSYEKTDLRTASKEVKEEIRKRAIGLFEQGKAQTEVTMLLQVNKNSVNTWYSEYKKHGLKAFKEKPRGIKKATEDY